MTRLLAGVIACLLVLLGLTAWVLKGAHERGAEQAAQIEALQESLRHNAKVRTADDRATLRRVITQTRILNETKELTRAIPLEVPPDSCPLPGGWRLLHDRAATGQAAPPASGPAPAPVPAQAAAATVIDNYATCRDTAEQLRQLQQWITEVTAE